MDICEVHQTKIKLLLERFLNLEITQYSDIDVEKLLTHLLQQEEREVESTLILLPVLTEWIKEAVFKWNSTKLTPQPSISRFTLIITSLLSKHEERFSALNNNNFFIKLVNVVKARQSGTAASVKLGYIKLLSAFLEHTSGIEWMMACNFWEDILQMGLSDQDEEVIKDSGEFMWKLLEKTVVVDGDFCNGVVKRLMLPLGENIYKSIKASSDTMDVTQEVASKYLKPTLQLIGTILEYFLDGIHFGRGDFEVLLVFLKNFHLEERISDFMIIAQSKCLVFELGKIMFIMQFLELYVKAATNSLSTSGINSSMSRIKKNYLQSISKGTFENCVEFCSFGQLYWNLMDLKIPVVQKNQNEPSCFSDQLVVLQILPYFCLLLKYCWEKDEIEALMLEHFRDLYIHKLFKMMYHDAIRACYSWRDALVLRSDLFKILTLCNTRLKAARKYFSRERAVIVVQSIIYNLSDIVNAVKECPQKFDHFSNETLYFYQLFDILAVFIEEFHITWKDTFEAIDLLGISFDLLMLQRWPACVVVQILNLINVATANYMAPNLALLLDSTKDSTITLMGPVLYAKLQDEVMEVKCAGLEVMCTLARISSSKFPSLQKVLMDSELPTLVVKMSSCDGESFVRATAIKCLQEMIQVEEIWNNSLKTEDLTQKMRAILLDETEGIVRVEAATFMCVAYEHQQFPKDTLDRIYEAMIFSSTTDLHWEVKVRALGFWDKVIKNHLQNQGMIDGTFPNVTFSKEHRKIVTLTDSEIRKRLLKVLNQLSSIGCLGVLMSAIKDDCDMEVSKTAVKITQRLVDLFKKYNVRSDCSTPTSPLPTENGMSATVSISSGISVDDAMDSPASSQHPEINEEIMDQIVNSKDVTLLKNVYAPSDYGSVSNYDIQVRKIVTPNEFLQFTQQDLNAIISEKKKWLNGIEDLGSLLDDMLKTYDDDVNNMDCY